MPNRCNGYEPRQANERSYRRASCWPNKLHVPLASRFVDHPLSV
jgi:hypothetical protein